MNEAPSKPEQRHAVRNRPNLYVSHDLWFGLSIHDQQETTKKYVVVIGPSYAPAEDLAMLREMAPTLNLEVKHG